MHASISSLGHHAPRVAARLDVKAPNLVKGIHLEGLRVIGDPAEHAQRYYEQGADELIYIDIVASLYGRNSLAELVERTARQVFVPLTVGGGIRSIADVSRLLRAGADKIAINTAAVASPKLLTEASRTFGAQCIVLGIEAKRAPHGGRWEAFTDNGRERTGLDVIEWARRAVDLGAGEILLTSVDNEGTRRGFDLDLVRAVSSAVTVPVVASGGAGDASHVRSALAAGADAVGVASALHYRTTTIGAIKAHLSEHGIEVVT